AHGLGDGHVPVPAVLPHDSQRDGRGSAARRRRPAALPVGLSPPAVVGEHRRAVRGPVHLRLEPVPLALHDHEYGGDADGGDRARGADPSQRHRAAHVEPHHGRRDDGAAAAGRHHRLHAALVREGPGREREVKYAVLALALAWVFAAAPAFAQGAAASLIAPHRGGALLWPANSLLAFRSAGGLGADFLEFDVHLSKDGEVIVIHDPTLDRTTTGTGPIRERTLAELKTLRLKDRAGAVTEEPIPTLDDVVVVA